MFETFESHAHQWMERYTIANEHWCQKSFADTPSSQSALDHFIRSAATAHPPIVLPSFAQESYLRACSENLAEDDSGAPSYEPDPKLAQPVACPLGRNRLTPLAPPYLDGNDRFERQDPQTVHSRFETIDKTFIAICGNIYQLREVIDYWLPKDNLNATRTKWLPSRLIEEARLRTINELNFVQVGFTDQLQHMNNALCQLREGAFGGRLNTKSVASAKELYEKLREVRRLVIRIQNPASGRTKALKAHAQWFEHKFLPTILQLRAPYQPERFDPNDPQWKDIGQVFEHHFTGMVRTVKFCGQAFDHLSGVFGVIDGITRTMVEGLHKLMLDVHMGSTTGEFIASWASRWERVSFGLLVKLLGLPAVNSGLQHDFPGFDADLN